MPPSGEMVGQKRQLGKPIPKEQDEAEGGDNEDSLDRFLEGWDAHHGVDVAGGIDKTQDPSGSQGREGGRNTQPPYRDDGRYPNFSDHDWYPNTKYPGGTYPSPTSRTMPTPSTYTEPQININSGTSICLTDTDSYATISPPTPTGYSPDLIGESGSGISYKTVTADTTGTVTDTATVIFSGGPTKGLFPQHDRATGEPNKLEKPSGNRLRDILLGVFVGAGMVILIVACIFLYRRYKRKKRRTVTNQDDPADTEQMQEAAPEMQTTGAVITMPSFALPTGPDMHLPPPPPFTSRPEPIDPSPIPNSSNIPIIINPFSDPTYNSSSGIEDYVVSNHVPLGREPENPFLHPDDRAIDVLDHARPNSAGDFPPEYTTVDGNPIDASGRRVREERFPFGDEALSLRTESETGSVRNEPTREEIPQYQYDDPNGVADGFRYNPAAAGRFPR